MKLKGLHVAETQEAVTDELKKIQKVNFRQLFRQCTTVKNSVYMPSELILNKKIMFPPHVSSVFTNISPKTFGPRVFTLYG
jgi:hypothetical protein